MNWIKTLKHQFLLLLAVFLFSTLQAETKDQHIKVALRTIGHEFLLQLNDSTSRVLPIELIEGRYAVKFEKEFSFEPDFLFFATFKVLEEFEITDSYIVEVEECDTPKVIHSFEASLTKDEEGIACKLRAFPADCYVFYFTVIENEQPKVKATTGWELWIILLIIVAVGGWAVFLIKQKRRSKQNADVLNIGLFQFDQKGMRLNLKAQTIELSSKETDLLYLLFSNENKTLEREYILNVVWGDEGDYVGRTLDVFISKLRKKLEADSNVKIINVRGVGYRFVVN
jgi:hypothetical protein